MKSAVGLIEQKKHLIIKYCQSIRHRVVHKLKHDSLLITYLLDGLSLTDVEKDYYKPKNKEELSIEKLFQERFMFYTLNGKFPISELKKFCYEEAYIQDNNIIRLKRRGLTIKLQNFEHIRQEQLLQNKSYHERRVVGEFWTNFMVKGKSYEAEILNLFSSEMYQ